MEERKLVSELDDVPLVQRIKTLEESEHYERESLMFRNEVGIRATD